MGTSNSYGGGGGDRPLVPSWVSNGGSGPPPFPPPPPAQPPPPGQQPQQPPGPPSTPGQSPAPNSRPPASPRPGVPPAPALPPIPASGDKSRYTAARTNFSKFASSGGRDRRSLGRAISNYVSKAAGGNRTAAQRMGAARQSSARLATFLSGVSANGPRAALQALNLGSLAGRPIEEIFVGLMDYVCPEGGSIDASIAREAFIETITELADNGLTDFDTLNATQLQTILELYAAHAIEARLCNDIGSKVVSLPSSVADAENVQAQLFDFIGRSVSDALTAGLAGVQAMTTAMVQTFIDGVYEQAFAILQSMGEAEEG